MRERSIVIIGLGQLGRVFASGFLRTGYTVVPVNRGDDLSHAAARVPDPALVLVGVAEADLYPALSALPPAWLGRVGLIQNELLPRDWEAHRIANPTVASVWFEKKKGMDAKPLIATPVHGPAGELLVAALQAIEIPARLVEPPDEFLYELVRKNVYILTTNTAGLQTGGTVGELWSQHRMLATEVANEVMDIQDWLTGQKHDRERLLRGMVEAFEADPQHACRGRTAADRLRRNLGFADQAGLPVPKLREIAAGVFA
jgi:ketopantoate reductase